jgi:hypothetical protein
MFDHSSVVVCRDHTIVATAEVRHGEWASGEIPMNVIGIARFLIGHVLILKLKLAMEVELRKINVDMAVSHFPHMRIMACGRAGLGKLPKWKRFVI